MARQRNLKEQDAVKTQCDKEDNQILSGLKRINSRTWESVDYHSLPRFLHDNEFLINGHRPQLNSTVECVKSVFMLHTETWNIWTHAVGAVMSVILSIYYWNNVAHDLLHGLVFAVFLAGATLCMGTSATYHTLICHSESVCKFLAKMDYCGIIVLAVASHVPWLHFAFYDDITCQLLYLAALAIFGSLCISFVVKDEFREPQYRIMRFGVFLTVGLASIVPAFHCLFFTDLVQIIGFPVWLFFTAFIYLLGGLTYATRFPEAIWPGKFDIWCQSHQIMHICVILGVLGCYHGAATLASQRLNHEAAFSANSSSATIIM